MIEYVLQAIKDAFNPQSVENDLRETNGRVLGSVKVIGSAAFDGLDDARRQQRFWENLRKLLGAESTKVGPVILEPTKRG
mgnify:CR=1 FL=1